VRFEIILPEFGNPLKQFFHKAPLSKPATPALTKMVTGVSEHLDASRATRHRDYHH